MISVIIPALNAAATLGACLAAVREADEILVIDGGSVDATAALAEAAGARLLGSARGRGTQLAAGAAASKGDWLLFLHADTRLAPGWRESAERHIARHADRAACFRLRLDAGEWQARLIEAGVALRVKLLALPYGDQGLLISRALYEAVGGHRPLPLMEDVDLVRRIGRARLARLGVDAVTSPRRWRSDGWLRRSGRNLLCLLLYRFGMNAERLARLYG
ncbi:MAG TPA: TIGR04283 family arsenosugar biosynthesis glycosyltransferase [Allosphingosinicella sp.]|nr:TIGR04283 family arsenosugar biosynthesis glycosyltransferase [Allosphingosinicella sp.]